MTAFFATIVVLGWLLIFFVFEFRAIQRYGVNASYHWVYRIYKKFDINRIKW